MLATKKLGASTPGLMRTMIGTTFKTNAASLQKALFSSGNPNSSLSSSKTFFWTHLWDCYTRALLKRPLLVKGGAASVIFLVSDTATQKLMGPSSKEKDWDVSRAISGSFFGVAATCWLHYWWGFLEVCVNKRLPVQNNKLANALTKVVADQLVGAPLYIYSYYCVTHFGTMWMEQKQNYNSKNTVAPNNDAKSSDKTKKNNSNNNNSVLSLLRSTSERALEMLPDTLLRHWTLWPVVHTLNFYFNPIHHRVLVQNIVLIFWSGYLSHLNNGGLLVVTPEQEIELTAIEHKQQQQQQQQPMQNQDERVQAPRKRRNDSSKSKNSQRSPLTTSNV